MRCFVNLEIAMHLMKYCVCYLMLDFSIKVTGQEYNLAGSSTFATLGENFTLICNMLNYMDEDVRAVRFFRYEILCVAVGVTGSICMEQSANPNYTYGCLSETIFTLTIPAEKMTKDEQGSLWRCGHITNSSKRSPAFTLQIAINVENVSLTPNDNPLAIINGTQREVRCVVDGDPVPAPTITWFLGSTNITNIAGSDTASIMITGKINDNKKILECRATNNNNPSKKANTTLNVEYPPRVNNLSQRDIIEGSDLLVNCTVTPGNPVSTTFYWTKVTLDNSGFRQNGSTLHLPKVQNSSSGTYQCTARNNYSNGQYGTDSQSMVVNVQYPPTVKRMSQKDIIEGRNLLVTCQTIPGNPSSTTIYWTKDFADFKQNGPILQFPNIQRTSNGTYRCTAENIYNNGEKGIHNQTIVINVLYPPHVEVLSKKDIIEGQTLEKNCEAISGNPSLTIIFWTKVDNPGFRQNGTTLLLPYIQRSSSGTYKCTAENNYNSTEKGIHSQQMVVDVLYQPTIQSIPLQIINESETVNITLDISSNPLSNVSWYDKTGLLKTQTSVATASFNIGKATCTDTKNFTLVVQNIIGNDTVLVEFIVNCRPKPDRNNITLGITEETGIEFSTIVIAYPEPYYILKNENGTANKRMMDSITRNAINNFTIHFNQTIVEQSDYGSYYLNLSNLFGTTTVLINVMPQRRPEVPRDLKVVCEASGARVQWVSSFNGGDNQTFVIYANEDQKTSYSNHVPDAGENTVHTIFVENLQPSVSYVFYVSAQNRHGNSSSENITCTTLKKDTGDNLPLIVGGAAAAGIALAVIAIAVVLLRRYMQIDKQAGKAQRLKQDGEKEDTSDDGIKDNILYVSAGPKVDEHPKAAVYASVNKKGPESNNNANVYAEVNKSGRIIAEEGALYSDVKPKRGLFKKDVNRKKYGNPKQKKGKKQKSKQDVADVYENSEDIAMSSKSDDVYSNTGQKVQNKEERGYKNKDGLLYVEVQFDAKTEKGNQTIHGEDEKTDYATVEFPMAASKHDESGNDKI